MPSQRMARVQKLLREEISVIIQRKLKDPWVTSVGGPGASASAHPAGAGGPAPPSSAVVSITRVDADPDLHNARVYTSIYGDAEHRRQVLAGLRRAAGFIRAELMQALHLRPMPLLDFRHDESLALAGHTLDVLDRIRGGAGGEDPARERHEQGQPDESAPRG